MFIFQFLVEEYGLPWITIRRIGIAVVPSVMEMGARTLIFNATGSTIRWGSIKVLK